MAFEKVLNEIQTQAENQRNHLRQEAEQQAKKILTDARQKAQTIQQEHEKKTIELVHELEHMQLSAHRLELNKAQLRAKKEILDRVFQNALEKASQLNAEEKKKVFKKLLASALKELPQAISYYTNAQDSKLVHELEPKLKNNGIINCQSGFVLENEDKTVKVNYTFEVLFDKIKEESRNEVSQKVFGK